MNLVRKFAGDHISCNTTIILKNWAHSVADNVYEKTYTENIPFTKAENYDSSGVRNTTDVKSTGLWSHLEASRVSTVELWYNATIYLEITIYI